MRIKWSNLYELPRTVFDMGLFSTKRKSCLCREQLYTYHCCLLCYVYHPSSTSSYSHKFFQDHNSCPGLPHLPPCTYREYTTIPSSFCQSPVLRIAGFMTHFLLMAATHCACQGWKKQTTAQNSIISLLIYSWWLTFPIFSYPKYQRMSFINKNKKCLQKYMQLLLCNSFHTHTHIYIHPHIYMYRICI